MQSPEQLGMLLHYVFGNDRNLHGTSTTISIIGKESSTVFYFVHEALLAQNNKWEPYSCPGT